MEFRTLVPMKDSVRCELRLAPLPSGIRLNWHWGFLYKMLKSFLTKYAEGEKARLMAFRCV